jgi:glycosyltransferase involved in cell wall biosynthesis
MRLLFVHQNFPGQYRHLATHYASQRDCEVVAVGENGNVLQRQPAFPRVRLLGYDTPRKEGNGLGQAIARGQVVGAGAAQLRRAGFRPDVICAHLGWGEALFLKDVFPEAKLLLYCEFFYRQQGGDCGFDPEFPPGPGSAPRLRLMNAPLLMALDACDWGVAPTLWQHRQFPPAYRPRIGVIHDGIDTDRIAFPPLPGDEEIVTFVARNLEPYRGFHVFMRAIPEIQKRRPKAHVVIVGGDEVSYSRRLPPGETYRARMLRELEGRLDLSRVHFTGRISYARYLSLLRASSAHVYLTYPFVLSWSLLEALAAGCAVIASRTPPVEEVITDGQNGLLVDFFSPEEIAARVEQALTQDMSGLREHARRTALERYDLRRVCLPAQAKLIEQLIRPAALAA